MCTFLKTILFAAPLFVLVSSAEAHKPRKTIVVTTATPAPVVTTATPAPVVATAAPAPVIRASGPAARVAVVPPPVVVAPPPARVAVLPPPGVVVTAPPPVVAVEAQVPQVTFTATPPVAAVQVQVAADSTYATTGPVPVAVQEAPGCTLRDESELQAVLGAIRSESFNSDQLRVLAEAAHGSCFTVAQIEQVIPLFSFEADQLKALQIMAPRILDRQNNFRIYGLFTFESGKQQARRLLAR